MALLPGFHASPWFDEQLQETWLPTGVRVVLTAALAYEPTHPTQLIVYATPNGNTVEQTLGSLRTEKTDWHFDIQHVAAQVRVLREHTAQENVVLACVAAKELSWPAWRQKHPDNAAQIRGLVERLRSTFPSPRVRLALTGHSGGGSFLFGFLNSGESLPEWVESLVFLDANYSYSDSEGHGDKLIAWLKRAPTNRLTVLAYDDREITLNGKKVLGPTGGTYRATERMRQRLVRDLPLTESQSGPVHSWTSSSEQVVLRVHENPKNQILHTALVGEWNGLLSALAAQPFSEPRRYSRFIQPPTGIPPRPTTALGGSAVFATLVGLPTVEREERLRRELLAGNLPEFLRGFKPVTLRAPGHTLVCRVAPDYLAVGSDSDFVRTPLTPMTARLLADAFGCLLPTCRLCDAISQQADLRLAPFPLTEAREAAKTFAHHSALIEAQRADKPLGLLVAGTKKDVVLTNRLKERPRRVAIYGWHKADGTPIQPLTIVHGETYVDYSHGIRLVQRAALLDGKPCDLMEVLQDPALCVLLSEEGPIAL